MIDRRFGEALTGTIDGANTVFDTASPFQSSTLRVHYNGVRIYVGASNDFTVTGSTEITLLFAPKSGDRLTADYHVSP